MGAQVVRGKVPIGGCECTPTLRAGLRQDKPLLRLVGIEFELCADLQTLGHAHAIAGPRRQLRNRQAGRQHIEHAGSIQRQGFELGGARGDPDRSASC